MRRAARPRSTLLGALLGALFTPPRAHANIPAAYLACEGAPLGEPCVMTGPQYGVCLLDALCVDPPSTALNECVLCVDACWGLRAEGEACTRPWTGEEGVCEAQERCTDRAETSFLECVRCVAPSAHSSLELSPAPSLEPSPDEAGCASRGGGAPVRLTLWAALWAALWVARWAARWAARWGERRWRTSPRRAALLKIRAAQVE